MAVATIKHKGYTIRVEQDEDAQNPRTEFDTFGKMICFHKRYDLGDKKTEEYEKDPQEFKKWIERHTGKDIISLPLFLFDHSGITMSTTNSNFQACDPQKWDWGLIGWTYIAKDDIRNECGKKRVSKSLAAKAKDLLRYEVKTYDDYLTGRVYGYQIVKDNPKVEDDEQKILDSCWGFYGDYNEYMVPEAKSIIDHWVEKEESAE